MRWLPRLLSHAAAAGRASAARATSHVRGGSHGFASGRDGPAVPREWLRKLWAEELKRQKEAAKRWGIGGTGDLLSAFASSEEPVLQDGRVIARGAADEAPSRSYQYDDRDLNPVEVEKIPLSFMSLDHYLISYVAPLIEETRSDLCSCLELITEAPSSKILSMEVAGKSGMYFMDVDFWDNGAGFSTESYTARNGDIFILSSVKPEAAEDFNRYGLIYCLAMVTEVSMDGEYQKGFRVKVAKDIGSEEDLSKFRHAIFLNNIMTNIRIWKALSFDNNVNNNFTIIKSLLAARNMGIQQGDDVCGVCVNRKRTVYLFLRDVTQYKRRYSYMNEHSPL